MKNTTNPVVGTGEWKESESPINTPRSSHLPCQLNRILIVDDEDGIRRVFNMVLSASINGITIDMASNGAKGVEAFKREHHSVILMDLSMPIMDGETAFLEIQRHCEHENWMMPAVVFCTGFNPSQNVRNIVSGNPRHCMLQKPVRNQILVESIQSRLG